MSWSLPTITAKTKAAAAAKAIAAFLTQTAEQPAHNCDRTLVSETIARAVDAIEAVPAADEHIVVTGNGHVTGGYEYAPNPGDPAVRVPVSGVTLTVSACIQKVPAPPKQA